MKQKKWFERSFPTDQATSMFSSILERLRGTPARLEERLQSIPNTLLNIQHAGIKHEDRWSIQEHVGHLLDLEPLWAGRLEDLLAGARTLRPADLTNTATDLANHNANSIQNILQEFRTIRTAFVTKLETLLETDLNRTALHPRLNTPMNAIDTMFFVAEHDDHHLVSITRIWQTLEQENR
jgi:uncharacterized damage-inducible protein DinB